MILTVETCGFGFGFSFSSLVAVVTIQNPLLLKGRSILTWHIALVFGRFALRSVSTASGVGICARFKPRLGRLAST
jgi:hypothetical protein